MNENEAKAYTGLEPEEAAEEVSKTVKTVIAKIGEKGSIIIDKNKKYFIDPFKVEAIDTTGAGDLFAAGYLNGLINKMSINESLAKGTELSSIIIQKIGARI